MAILDSIPVSLGGLNKLKDEIAANPELADFCKETNASRPRYMSAEASLKRSVDATEREIIRARQRGVLLNAQIPPNEGLDLNSLSLTSLTLRGQDHACVESACQDYVTFRRSGRAIVAVVADGVGSVPFSHFGANLLADHGAETLQRLLAQHETLPVVSPQVLGSLHHEIYQEMQRLTREVRLTPLQAHKTFLACTLLFLVTDGRELLVFGLGDGFQGQLSEPQDVLRLIQRELALECEQSGPPLVSQVLREQFVDAYRTEIGKMTRSEEELKIGPTQDRLAMEVKLARFEEALSFKIIAHRSIKDALDTPYFVATDGFRFVRSPNVPLGFPLEDLFLKGLAPAEIVGLALLFNLIAPACPEEINLGDPVRTGHLLDLVATNEKLSKLFFAQLHKIASERPVYIPGSLRELGEEVGRVMKLSGEEWHEKKSRRLQLDSLFAEAAADVLRQLYPSSFTELLEKIEVLTPLRDDLGVLLISRSETISDLKA